MNEDSLKQLSIDQAWTMAIAHEVRNALEKFHADGGYGLIPDSLMHELNHTVRTRVHDIVYCLLNCDERHPECRSWVSHVLRGVPSYWEVPKTPPEESQEDEDKENKRWTIQALTPKEKKLVRWFKRAFVDQRGDVKAEQVIAQMKAMKFCNDPPEDWNHLSWFGNIYRRAGLASWSCCQRKGLKKVNAPKSGQFESKKQGGVP